MSRTFLRATLGFTLLTTAVVGIAAIALWAVHQFGGGSSWASLLIIVIALILEVSVYSSTLHDPFHTWINEPRRSRSDTPR